MIEIGIDPVLLTLGSLTLSWHGIASFVGVSLAVYLVGRWAPRYGIPADTAYGAATWGIIGGILGARLVFVLDDLGYYIDNPEQALFIWRGGLAIWGGFLGGFVGAWIYMRVNKLEWRTLADVTAPTLVLALMVGRIGDIINGEHFGEFTGKTWGAIYTHPATQSLYIGNGMDPTLPTHPGVIYEFIWLTVVFSILWWVLKDRIRPAGMLFASFLALYAFGRFFILFFHAYRNWIGDLNEAQLICLGVLVVTVPILAFKATILPRSRGTGSNVAARRKT
mgnify:CR=1 FL=1